MTLELWDFEDGELLHIAGGRSITFDIPTFGLGSFNRLDYCQWCGSTVMRRINLEDTECIWIATPTGCPGCCRRHHRWWTARFPIEEFPENEPLMPQGVLMLEFLINFPSSEVETHVSSITQGPTDGTQWLRQDPCNSDAR